jgi:tetratricopeptide (TPR) repeat protein
MSKSKVRSKVTPHRSKDQGHPTRPKGSSWRCHGLGFLVSLFLVVATLVACWQVRDYGFMDIDDGVYITENPHVQTGLTLKGVMWAFTTVHASNWHPLTWLSHMLDCQLYGLNAAGHHLTSLFFHIANTLLLFLVLKRMSGSLWGSGFIAALFALHPLHAESVVWIAERKDVLSTFFWILTMGAYVRYAERPQIHRYLLVLLCFVLGLLSKPMLVTLPFVMLLLDYYPLGRLQFEPSDRHRDSHNRKPLNPSPQRSSLFHLLKEKVPFFILVAASSLITVYAQQRGGAVGSLEVYPLEARVVNAMTSYVRYIGKMVWPQNLAVLYPYPEISPVWGLGAGLCLVGISILVIRVARRHPYLLVGWFWYLGTLVPVIGLVQVGLQSMADRYTYVPLIGLFIMIANGVPGLLAKWRYQKSVLSVAMCLVVLTLIIMTRTQVSYWRSNLSLFEHTLKVTSDNSRIHLNLGYNLLQQGNIQEAITHYTEALRIDPRFAEAHYNMGVALAKQGKSQEAIAHYAEALKLNPNYADAHNNLGIILARQEKNREAIAHFAEALRIKPDRAEIYINMANSLSGLGEMDGAVSLYRKALDIQPDHFGAHYNLGKALVRQGKTNEAIVHYRKSVQIRPNFAEAHFDLGLAYVTIGAQNRALEEYAILKTIDPELAQHLSQKIPK